VNRALFYFSLAIALGLLTILVPLMAFAGLHGGGGVFKADSLLRGFRELEGSYTVPAGASDSEVDVLLISLTVASIVYLLFRRRIPGQDQQWTKF